MNLKSCFTQGSLIDDWRRDDGPTARQTLLAVLLRKPTSDTIQGGILRWQLIKLIGLGNARHIATTDSWGDTQPGPIDW